MDLPTTKSFYIIMQPITRFQLQNAAATAQAEKMRVATRKQEVDGQIWAESVYHSTRSAAERGDTSLVFYVSQNLTDTGKNYGLNQLREFFPDSDITVTFEGKAYIISWAPKLSDLNQRRLEKETSW
jgi:hypothetical protein